MKMLKTVIIGIAVLLFVSFTAAQDFSTLSTALSQAKGDYVGSEACGVCHAQIYVWVNGSGHPNKLRSAEQAKGAGIPLPEGLIWGDIWKVIGGHGWKARFIKNDGYIFTAGGKNQWNLATKTWGDYHKDEVKPYKCGPCHMTNYTASGNQDYKPGVVGQWTYDGVQCEECHGPGKDHVLTGGSKGEITIDDTSAGCGKCHYRTDPAIIPAKGGFIKHHEQYNEFLKSGHSTLLKCVSCHDPHKSGGFSVKISCETCHSSVDAVYADSSMGKAGVKCIDCHMPYMSKSAVSERKWVGDVRTHLFNIDLSADAQPFTSDGSQATGITTSEYACLACHYDHDKAWAAGYKGVIHSLK